MEDLFIRVCQCWSPGCFVIEPVCLRQQAWGVLGSSSPVVRLYPSRLSDTGCYEVGWAQDKLQFLHQQEWSNEQTKNTWDVALACQVYILRAQTEGLGLAEKLDYAVGRPNMSCCFTEKACDISDWMAEAPFSIVSFFTTLSTLFFFFL